MTEIYKKYSLASRKIVGSISQLVNLGYGCCGHCKRTWNICEIHFTMYLPPLFGCFCLCKECWNDFSPAERLPFYWNMFVKWKSNGEPDHHGMQWDVAWRRIEEAVLKGE